MGVPQGKRISAVLDARCKEIARRVLWGESNVGEIARAMGLRQKQVTYIMYNHPHFQQVKAELESTIYAEIDQRHRDELEQVRQKARNNAMAAMDTIISLMEKSLSDNIKRDCANDILDYAEVQQSRKIVAPSITLSNNQINLLVQAAKEDDNRRLNP